MTEAFVLWLAGCASKRRHGPARVGDLVVETSSKWNAGPWPGRDAVGVIESVKAEDLPEDDSPDFGAANGLNDRVRIRTLDGWESWVNASFAVVATRRELAAAPDLPEAWRDGA